jgi:hypothetical protein
MIYLLEFTGSLYEFKNSHGRSSIALHNIVKNRPDMMILHRYDLFFHFDNKFQTNDPDKIDLLRLDGKNAMVYHLDLYSGCSEKIVPLIRYCIENKIDLFVPVSDGVMHAYVRDDTVKNPHRYEIREILEGYEHVIYDFKDYSNKSNMDFMNLKMKEMIRDLNIRDLLG